MHLCPEIYKSVAIYLLQEIGSYREPIRYIDKTSELAICAVVTLSTSAAKEGSKASLNMELKNKCTQIASFKGKTMLI